MFADMVPSLRETLAVSSAYDDTTILPGLRRAAAFLLRTYNFPKSLTLFTSAALAIAAKEVVLPVNNLGTVVVVRLTKAGPPAIYKRLRKTLIAEPPRVGGPQFYWLQGNKLVLDTPMAEAGWVLEVWYHNTDPVAAEAWLSGEFEDILFTRAVVNLALDLRKPEVYQAYNSIWSEQVPTLATYLNEVEFNDLDIRMGPMNSEVTPRYNPSQASSQ